MKITVRKAGVHDPINPKYKWVAYWGEDLADSNVWGEGLAPEDAVLDLVYNYEAPNEDL